MTDSRNDRLAAALAIRRSQSHGLAHHPNESARLAPTQFGLWYAIQQDPSRSIHHRTTVYDVHGPIDPVRLHSSLIKVAQRHDALRSHFTLHENEVLQHVADCELATVPFEVVTQPDFARAVERAIADANTHIFELDTAPFQATLVVGPSDHAVLVLAISHLIFDGNSEQILLQDLAAIYRDEMLEPLTHRFVDWAEWRADTSESAKAKTDRDWLVNQFTPIVAPLQICSAWVQADQGEPGVFALDPTISDAVRSLARGERVTPFAVIITALALMLRRDAFNSEATITLPFDGRTQPEVASIIGCFVGTLPLRIGGAPNSSPRQMLQQVHRQIGALQDHNSTTLGQVENALRLKTQREDPVNGTISAQWRKLNDPPNAGDGVRFIARSRAPLGAGIHLRVDETPTGITLRIGNEELANGWLDADAILSSLTNTVEHIVRDPDQRWLPNDPQPSIVNRIDEFRVSNPERIAMESEQWTLTRAEIHDRVLEIMDALARQGVRRGDAVAILAAGLEGILVEHALWRAGAVCIPIDQHVPAEYRKRILALTAPVLTVESVEALLEMPDAASPIDEPPVNPDDLDPAAPALVLFTSGSTGAPSGVVVQRSAVEHYVRSAITRYGLNESDRLLQVHSLAFDASLIEAFAIIAAGATVISKPPSYGSSAKHFFADVQRLRTTLIDLPTALWHELTMQIVDNNLPHPPTLRLVIIGGQAASQTTVTSWLDSWPSVPLVNAYGPTEATVEVLTYRFDGSDDAMHCDTAHPGQTPIGGAVENVACLIIDDAGEGAVITGEGQGELWVSSPQLTLGYLGNEALSDTRFIVGAKRAPIGRWYRTGDLVRRDIQGTCWFVGRIDGQLKVRGFRVETREVESVLMAHPSVREAAVTLNADQLVAHLICNSPTPPPTAIMNWVGDRLPRSCIPTHVSFLDSFPRTPGGKPDRNALTQWAPQDETANNSDAPIDEILQVWRTVLGSQAVRDTDNFFLSGGTSLLAVRLIGNLERELGIRVTLAMLVQSPTVAQLRESLDSAFRSRGGLINLTETPGKPRLFLIPPGGGELVAYREFAQHFAGSATISSFELPGLDGTSRPLSGLASFTQWYTDQIVAECEDRPHIIAGYSLSSFLAVEVAKELQLRGRQVAALIMVDPNQRIRFRAARRWLDGNRNETLATILRRGVRRRHTQWRISRGAARLEHATRRTTDESLDLVWHKVTEAFKDWEPSPIDLAVVVYRAVGTPTQPIPVPSPEPMRQFAPHCEVQHVAGMHAGANSVFAGPFGRDLAQHLINDLERFSR